MVAMSTSALPTNPLGDACFAASQSLKAMLDREMLEAVAGRAGYGRVRAAKEEAPRSRRSRYRERIDLRCFAPHDGRPRSASGATSFHFALETIVKAGGDGGVRAAGFDRYVSDPDKVEQVTTELHERYLVQAKAPAPDASPDGRAAFIISTIGTTLEERERFWVQRERHARSAGVEALVFRAAKGKTAEWRALADAADTPAYVAAVARRIDESNEREVRGEPIVVEIANEEVRRWAKELRQRFGDKADTRMVHYRQPRAGRVQMRFVMELPEEFDAADRCAVVEAFTDALLPRMTDRCLPLTAVIHAPDLSNDDRNFHCHLILAPAIYGVAADGSIDHDDKRELRPGELAKMVAPERARAIDRLRPGERIAEDGLALRRFFAELCNERLEQRKAKRRLDPRSYAEMGIEQDPQEHLSSQAAALVAAGCSVEADHRNAVRSWTGVDRRRLAKLAESRSVMDAQLRRMDEALAGEPPSLARARLARLQTDYAALADTITRNAAALSAYDMLAEMARSAADRLLRKSERSLQAAHLVAPKTTAAQEERRLIQARYDLARNHLHEIDARIEPWREEIGALRTQLVEDRRTLGTIADSIDAALNDMRQTTPATPVDWWADTILGAPRSTAPLRPHDHASRLIEHLREQGPADYPPERFILVCRDPAGAPAPIGLRAHDLALLRQPGTGPRLRAQLENTATYQAMEVDRLLAAVGAHGLSNVVAGRKDGQYLPGAPDELHKRYRNHPRYRAGEGTALAAYDRARRDALCMPVSSTAFVPTSGIVTGTPANHSVDPRTSMPSDTTVDANTSRAPKQDGAHRPASNDTRLQDQLPRQLAVETPDASAKPTGSSVLPSPPVASKRADPDVPIPSKSASRAAHIPPSAGADDRQPDAVDVPVATPPSAKSALPTPAHLAERQRATPHNDRLRALHRDAKHADGAAGKLPIGRPDPVQDAVERLRDMPFVPVRERDGRLTIEMERAIEEDGDALRRIKEVEQEAAIQALLQHARDAMLARLRHPDGALSDKDDRRYRAAVRAAHDDPAVIRLMLARPSSASGAHLAALRAEMRAQPEQKEKDGRAPTHPVDDDALYRALWAMYRSDLER